MLLRELIQTYGDPDLQSILGDPIRELELTFYAKLKSFKGFELALSQEQHEQWELKFDSRDLRGRLRLVNKERHELTTKRNPGDNLGDIEVTNIITPALYTEMLHIAPVGYAKTRYTFPTEHDELQWEVDVFKDRMGQDCLWVKIDLELKSMDDKIPELPLEVEKVILKTKQMSMEDKDQIEELWGKTWASMSAVDSYVHNKPTDVVDSRIATPPNPDQRA